MSSQGNEEPGLSGLDVSGQRVKGGLDLPTAEDETTEFWIAQFKDLTLEEAIFQALGAASVCWDDEKVFRDGRARAIGYALLDKTGH